MLAPDRVAINRRMGDARPAPSYHVCLDNLPEHVPKTRIYYLLDHDPSMYYTIIVIAASLIPL